ncbi:hypothetical protein LshimejAT787_0210450 [Lyophyllum shimeji]|uniref:MYND-type domain-containing protein n=1 Tax=Lyophyllum shimeji TaxID=47721 RepID=A0A9P3PGC4_LYOSH|nr:hypothetical protein LshimejAT787_0210450 [Lyophyllum shimeji]
MSADAYVAADVANYEQSIVRTSHLKHIAAGCPLELALAGKLSQLLNAEIFVFFRPDPLPMPGSSPNPRFWDVFHAIQALNHLLARFPETSMPINVGGVYAVICDIIVQQWANLWKWVESGTRRGLLQKKHPLPENLLGLLLANLTQFMHACSSYRALRKQLFERGYNALIDVWYIQALHASPLDAVLRGTPASTLIDWLPEHESKNMVDYWNKIVRRIGRPDIAVARLVLLRFLQLIPQAKDIAEDTRPPIAPHIDFMTHMLDAPLVRGLLAKLKAPYFFTRSLVHFSYDTIAIPGLRTHQRRVLIREQMCQYLIETFRLTEGIVWVRRSLEAGLLLAILRSAPRSPSEDVVELCELVNVISTYLIYISVLRPAARALVKMDLHHMERDIAKRGPFWDAWKALTETVDARALVAGSRIAPRCSYPKCDPSVTKLKFRRCSGCEDALYCSSTCQRLDWTDTSHRTYCKKMQQSYDGDGAKLSEEDYAFCKLVFLEDVKRRDDDIGIARRRYPIHLHMQIDYTKFPPETTYWDLRDKQGHTTFTGKLPHGHSFHKVTVTTEPTK